MLHCDLRVRWKVAIPFAISGCDFWAKTPFFCRISVDLAPSARKSLAIAIVRFWCAKQKKTPQTKKSEFPSPGGSGVSREVGQKFKDCKHRNSTSRELPSGGPDTNSGQYHWTLGLPFESKLLPAVLLLLRIYFPKLTVTVTVVKFGWITITVTVLPLAVAPSFPLTPNYRLESHLNYFLKITVTVTVLKCFWLER